MTTDYIFLPVEGGGSGGGITSINGDTTAAQLIVGGTGISVATLAGTTTISATGGTGTVTSVGLALPVSVFTVSGSPVTTSGTLTGSFATQTANRVFAGPTSGGAATPTFRALVTADMPAGTGTVTSVSVVTANGISGSVATATTTPAITLALGAITPTSVNGTTSTEIGYVSGVTSAIQTQLNGKQASGNYITALTTDVTASGPGSVAATIAVGAVTDTKASLAGKPACTVVATTNQALTGTPVIDGQATAAGSLILLTAQSAGAENGPWVAAAGAWARPTWYPSGGTTQAFQFITALIRLGTTYQGTTWRMTTSGAITIDTTATTWVVTPYAINSNTITGTVPTANTGSNLLISTAGITIDGGGAAISTGIKGDILVPFAATITQVTMLADQSGSIVVDVWKDTYANYPPTVADTITASAKPTISATNKSQDSTLTGWTTSVAAGDTIRFNVDSATTITRLNLTLKLTRT